MKKILILIFVFLLLIAIKFSESTEIKMKVGENLTLDNKILNLKRISLDRIRVSVNGVESTILDNEEKTVNNLKIKIISIFYEEEESERFANLDINSSFSQSQGSCGDHICNNDETKVSCCKDCGCNTGYECIDHACELILAHECNNNQDCEDNNTETLDLCKGTPRKCAHLSTVQCTKDLDCEDNNPCTKDECKNKECFNTKITNCESNKTTETNKEINQSKVEFKTEKKGFLSKLWFKILNLFKKR